MKGLHAVPCSLRKANDFVERHHRHSQRTARNGGEFAVAACFNGVIVAVAIVGNPLSATYMDGVTAEVLRSCCVPGAPRNCNSFLYGVCRRIWFEMGGRRIITYTLQSESGVSLRAAGWVRVAEVRGHSSETWGKKDHLSGKRSQQAVFQLPKFRWESVNPSFIETEVDWTHGDLGLFSPELSAKGEATDERG